MGFGGEDDEGRGTLGGTRDEWGFLVSDGLDCARPPKWDYGFVVGSSF